MASPRVAFLEHVQNGVLTDAYSVTLEDPTGTFGIRELVTENLVISPGAPTVHVGVGQYEYNIDSLNKQIEYEIFWKVIDSTAETQFIYGIIPIVTPASSATGMPVPPNQVGHGRPSDPDHDGDIDGYEYDLALDGYVDAYGVRHGDGYAIGFDFNNDGIIDALDIGTVTGNPGTVFDARGVRIGLGGNVFGTEFILNPALDGIPDIPVPRGTPAQNGTWGNSFGYDGTSGDLPATGGARTNRNPDGTGYWDGISFGNLCTIPIGPRGQCLKDKAHAIVRAMLKDTDPGCFAFTDDEVDMYLEGSLYAFNARPTFTAFLWDNLQERWLDIICKGAVIWALFAQGLIEAGREFTITDNGISFTPPPVSDKIHGYATALLAHYDAQLAEIKQNFRPIPAAVGIFSVLDVSPSLRRLRHLREKRIF